MARITQIAVSSDGPDAHAALIVLRSDGTVWKRKLDQPQGPWDQMELPPGTKTETPKEAAANCPKCQQPTFYAYHSTNCPHGD